MCNCIPHHIAITAYTATQRRNPLPFLYNSLMPYHDSRLSDPPPARISSPPTAKEPPDLLRRRIGNHRNCSLASQLASRMLIALQWGHGLITLKLTLNRCEALLMRGRHCRRVNSLHLRGWFWCLPQLAALPIDVRSTRCRLGL